MTLDEVLKAKSIGEAELAVLSQNKHLLSAKELKKYFGEGEEEKKK